MNYDTSMWTLMIDKKRVGLVNIHNRTKMNLTVIFTIFPSYFGHLSGIGYPSTLHPTQAYTLGTSTNSKQWSFYLDAAASLILHSFFGKYCRPEVSFVYLR